jgi:flagellar motor switch/type III secretory pathway protein FliN
MAMAAEVGLALVPEKPAGEVNPAANPALENESGMESRWKPLLDLGCELTVDLAMPDFTIADLLKLRKGSILNAHWRVGRDVPLDLNATLIGWIEFEVVAGNLAVRLTELA